MAIWNRVGHTHSHFHCRVLADVLTGRNYQQAIWSKKSAHVIDVLLSEQNYWATNSTYDVKYIADVVVLEVIRDVGILKIPCSPSTYLVVSVRIVDEFPQFLLYNREFGIHVHPVLDPMIQITRCIVVILFTNYRNIDGVASRVNMNIILIWRILWCCLLVNKKSNIILLNTRMIGKQGARPRRSPMKSSRTSLV